MSYPVCANCDLEIYPADPTDYSGRYHVWCAVAVKDVPGALDYNHDGQLRQLPNRRGGCECGRCRAS